MNTFQNDLALTLGSLELGVIPSNVKSIDSALSTMEEESARRAKRKFRKIKRRLHKRSNEALERAYPLITSPGGLPAPSKAWHRKQVTKLCRATGHKLMRNG